MKKSKKKGLEDFLKKQKINQGNWIKELEKYLKGRKMGIKK